MCDVEAEVEDFDRITNKDNLLVFGMYVGAFVISVSMYTLWVVSFV